MPDLLNENVQRLDLNFIRPITTKSLSHYKIVICSELFKRNREVHTVHVKLGNLWNTILKDHTRYIYEILSHIPGLLLYTLTEGIYISIYTFLNTIFLSKVFYPNYHIKIVVKC